MTPPPKISVVLTAYNAERYVEEAVESILAQTFADFEFIAIDDGSTDGTLAILKRYEAVDGRLRLVSRPNTGLARALNEGLGLARGELIARMDADDVAMPERFAWQVDYLRDHPEVVCLGGAQEHIDSAGRLLWVHRDPAGDDAIQDRLLDGHCAINHPSVMMRREVALGVGGYRAEMEQLEDLDLWLRMGERGRLANLDRVVTRYRVHEGAKSDLFQDAQAGFAMRISGEACDRRGIARRAISATVWRATDRSSKHQYAVIFGWSGFNRGDRPMALHYGLRAVKLVPWRLEGWQLLACALLKKPVGRTI